MGSMRQYEKRVQKGFRRGSVALGIILMLVGLVGDPRAEAQTEGGLGTESRAPISLPEQFLNARGLSSIDEANSYYAQIDPTREEQRRSCAIVDTERPDQVQLTHLGAPEDYTPGLQLRIFFNEGESVESQTRLIASGSGSGVHRIEDGFSKIPQGICLEYLIIGALPTLESWLDHSFGPGGSGDYVGKSFNIQDLGFGRYTAGAVRGGNVYTYVQNFTTLQGAVDHPGPREAPGAAFATVAIEYSPTFEGSSVRSLKYFIYNAAGVRTAKLDLDGTGQKYLPKVCSVCHSDRFLPIDLDSQLFSTQSGATRADQEESFYQLNQLLLEGRPTDHARELIGGWYLSSHQQDSGFVPAQWQTDPQLYLEFVKPYCRACHTTQSRDWFASPGFFRILAGSYEDRICSSIRPMPNALLTWALLAADPRAIGRFEQETGVLIRCFRENVDLEARIISIVPGDPVAGDQPVLSLEVGNVGDKDFLGSTTARLRTTDPVGVIQEIELVVGSITAQGSQAFSVQLDLYREGQWSFEWIVDPDDLVDEYPDVNNNRAVLNVDVAPAVTGPLPNLSMTPRPESIAMTPSNPRPGDIITFTIRILNEGPGDIPSGVAVSHRITVGSLVSHRGCAPIAAGQECVVTHTIVATAGLGQRIRVQADINNLVEETDETDNERSLYFNVTNPSPAVTCQGTWHLTGVGHGFNASSTGSVVNGCDVYWGQNLPTTTCWQTTGIDDIEVTWFRDGQQCPVRASAYRPSDQQTFLYTVTIEP